MTDRTTIQITPYFADGEKYPDLIGVRAEGDECETAYVKKSDMAEAVDYWRRMYEGVVGTRWHDLFGTPERAARTLLDTCDNCGQNDCSGCQVYEFTSGGDLDYDALLEWLRGEGE